MPTFYTGGNFSPFVPRQVQMLPFDLLRSTLVTRSPEAIQAALQDERDGAQRPMLVPQKMAFVRWHDTAGYGENVQGMHAALQGEQDKLASIQSAVRQTPMNDVTQSSHADGRNAMPRLSSELDPNLLNVPVSRGIIPWNHLVEPGQLYTAQAPATRVIDHATASAVAAATAPAQLGNLRCGKAPAPVLGATLSQAAPAAIAYYGSFAIGGALLGYFLGSKEHRARNATLGAVGVGLASAIVPFYFRHA